MCIRDSTGTVLEVAGGIPSWAAKGFTSRTRAYQAATDQHIPNVAWTRILLETEAYDGDGEMNIRIVSGQADATEAFKLHDNAVGFAAGDVGAMIWNTTDDTYAKVTGFVDDGELDIDTDIMVNGENYKLYHSRFTATSAGYYAIAGSVRYSTPVSTKVLWAVIKVNDGFRTYASFQTSRVDIGVPNVSDILYLAASDYVELFTYHDCAVVEALGSALYDTYMAIHRLS